jgi:hypothetical protein
MRPLADIEGRLGDMLAAGVLGPESAPELLSLGEEVLEHWVSAKGLVPTQEAREGFRLLALHRQGCADEPSFNACRETCRELAWHYNLVTSDPGSEATPRRLSMMTMVANHLFLFVSGKLQVAGLGDFCCASRPLRAGGA